MVASEPACKRAMQGAGSAAFALHLNDRGTVPQMFVLPSDDHWSANSPMVEEGVMG